MKTKLVGITALLVTLGLGWGGVTTHAQTPAIHKDLGVTTPLVQNVAPNNGLNNSKDFLTIPKSELSQSITLPSSARSFSAVADDTYGTNTTPDQALFIQTGQAYQGYIAAEGESRWFYTQVTNPAKLTSFLSVVNSAAVDYDLSLYYLNEETSEIQQVAFSTKGPTQYEQLSHIAKAGYYFIRVSSYQGADTTNPFTVFAVTSDSYDASEPDDNPWLAKDKGSAPFVSTQNIDNRFDEDWTKVTLTAQSKMNLRLDNASAYGTYQLQLFNANLVSQGTLAQNTNGQVTLPAGTYYIQVLAPSTFDLTTPYKLSVNYQTADVSRVAISNITTDGGVYGFINYGQGNKWRVKNNIVISGRAFDATGNPVANAIVTTNITTILNGKVIPGTATTDASGNFTMPVNIDNPGVGQYTFQSSKYRHYYDIVRIQFFSNGKPLNSDISTLYHFAYEIYTG